MIYEGTPSSGTDIDVDTAVENDFRYIISDDLPYHACGCSVKDIDGKKVLLANWKTELGDDAKQEIAKTIEVAVSRKYPVIIPDRHADIAELALKLIYTF
jgi:hypothetical protein